MNQSTFGHSWQIFLTKWDQLTFCISLKIIPQIISFMLLSCGIWNLACFVRRTRLLCSVVGQVFTTSLSVMFYVPGQRCFFSFIPCTCPTVCMNSIDGGVVSLGYLVMVKLLSLENHSLDFDRFALLFISKPCGALYQPTNSLTFWCPDWSKCDLFNKLKHLHLTQLRIFPFSSLAQCLFQDGILLGTSTSSFTQWQLSPFTVIMSLFMFVGTRVLTIPCFPWPPGCYPMPALYMYIIIVILL